MLLHPQLKGCRHSTRDVDIIKRAMVAEWRARGVQDADARLTACIRKTATVFHLGQDWMNADADVALPMAKDPQGRTYDPIAAASLNQSNLDLHTIFTSPGLTLVAVAPFWAVALKLVRYKKHDPPDIAALLRSGTRLNGVRWSREVLEGWLLNECWAMGYASYPEWLVADMRERIKHAISLIENDPPPEAPPLYPPSRVAPGLGIPAPQPFGSSLVSSAPAQQHTLVPPPPQITSSWSHEHSASMAAIASQPPPWAREPTAPPAPPRSPTPPPIIVHDMTPAGPPPSSHIHDMTRRSQTAHLQHVIPAQGHSRHHSVSVLMHMPSASNSAQINRHHTVPSLGASHFGSGSSISLPFDPRSSHEMDPVPQNSLLLGPESHNSGRGSGSQFSHEPHFSSSSQPNGNSRSPMPQFSFDPHAGIVSPPLSRPMTSTIRNSAQFSNDLRSTAGSPSHPAPVGSRNSFPFASSPSHFPPSFPAPSQPTPPPLGRPAHLQHLMPSSHSQQSMPRPHLNPQPHAHHRPAPHTHSQQALVSMPRPQLRPPSQHQQPTSHQPPTRRSDRDDEGEPPVIPPEFTMGTTTRGGWSGLLPRVGIRV
jgi:hypothetical protein